MLKLGKTHLLIKGHPGITFHSVVRHSTTGTRTTDLYLLPGKVVADCLTTSCLIVHVPDSAGRVGPSESKTTPASDDALDKDALITQLRRELMEAQRQSTPRLVLHSGFSLFNSVSIRTKPEKKFSLVNDSR